MPSVITSFRLYREDEDASKGRSTNERAAMARHLVLRPFPHDSSVPSGEFPFTFDQASFLRVVEHFLASQSDTVQIEAEADPRRLYEAEARRDFQTIRSLVDAGAKIGAVEVVRASGFGFSIQASGVIIQTKGERIVDPNRIAQCIGAAIGKQVVWRGELAP